MTLEEAVLAQKQLLTDCVFIHCTNVKNPKKGTETHEILKIRNDELHSIDDRFVLDTPAFVGDSLIPRVRRK